MIASRRDTVSALLLAFLLMIAPGEAYGHAVVFPKRSAPGAYEKYVLRVPNEKGMPTTRVEIRFPRSVRVVSFGEVAGWQLEEVRDSSNAVVAAIWTGTLPPERFVEFPFVAVNPKEDSMLTWAAYQTYADGERVDWTGADGSEKPASSTSIAGERTSSENRLGLYISIVAVLLSLMGLGLALRRAS
jgi:uncharacterized protein YcnI